MKLKVSEKEIENQILDWLKTQGIFAWKNQSVGIYDPVKKTFRNLSRHQLRGVPDILGLLPSGRMLAIEVKSKTGRVSEAQKEFQRNFEITQGFYILARSLQDVIDKMHAKDMS